MTTRTPSAATGAYPLRRLLAAGAITIAVAVAANLATYALLAAVVDMPTGFQPLAPGSVAVVTTLFTAVGVGVFALLTRRARNPARAWRVVASLVLVISIIPNLLAALNPSAFPLPGATSSAFLILTVFHLIAGAVAIFLLPRLARTR